MSIARAARATLVLVFAALQVVAGCTPAAAPPPPPAPPPAPIAPPPPSPAIFDFHSSFWVDLHHRLHFAATARGPAPPWAPPPPPSPAWTAAVAFYQARFGAAGGWGLVFDDALIELGTQLGRLESAPSPTGLDPALAAQLTAAAAVVRPAWPAQDRANRAWIAALAPRIERHGAALRDVLVQQFQAPWPPGPIRVDVSALAGPVSAYTLLGPTHTTISSADPYYAGDAALEMIFHEASHALIEPIQRKLDAAAARRGRQAPDQLWHALLFYTVGEAVADRLGPGYVPYATRKGMWTKAWPTYEPALRRDWQPYLDGRIDLDRALEALIDDLR